ncbi:hypothetical protein [Sphingomonas carotinifaciens]|uniref:Uncharacterized protein n=1 Tax=Sphingomonas carotinifaciens TaxID=1166323 RepID=A0A1G7P0L6_9SPHN|nr:hypothetical protein [Sphingomonas carotinifaciens]MBB4087262.1 hypothetical protein [Sphingomonas carotinifaciens]MWC44709.1 hypothetical protein [Sphingomonas carotinifaciens]SDF79835.1 hypothetical protein SAMN05216557_10617 [Sphingomonas carotinifaciens]
METVTGAYHHGDARGETARFTDRLLRERTTAITNAGNAKLIVMGSPLSLPASKLRTALRIGTEVSRLAAFSTIRTGVASANSSAQFDLNAQTSVNVALTSRRTGFLGVLGTVTANMNGAVRRVSGYATLDRSATASTEHPATASA